MLTKISMWNRYHHYYVRTFSSHIATHNIRLMLSDILYCALLQSCFILQRLMVFQIPDKKERRNFPSQFSYTISEWPRKFCYDPQPRTHIGTFLCKAKYFWMQVSKDIGQSGKKKCWMLRANVLFKTEYCMDNIAWLHRIKSFLCTVGWQLLAHNDH